MTKKEKIIEAWGLHYAPDIDENGFRKYSVFDNHLLYQWSDDWFLKSYNELSREWCVIPKSLKGIEHNNGWVKIENKSDLPTQDGMYWGIYEDDPNPICIRLINSKPVVLFGCLSYIKHIPNPEPPIY